MMESKVLLPHSNNFAEEDHFRNSKTYHQLRNSNGNNENCHDLAQMRPMNANQGLCNFASPYQDGHNFFDSEGRASSAAYSVQSAHSSNQSYQTQAGFYSNPPTVTNSSIYSDAACSTPSKFNNTIISGHSPPFQDNSSQFFSSSLANDVSNDTSPPYTGASFLGASYISDVNTVVSQNCSMTPNSMMTSSNSMMTSSNSMMTSSNNLFDVKAGDHFTRFHQQPEIDSFNALSDQSMIHPPSFATSPAINGASGCYEFPQIPSSAHHDQFDIASNGPSATTNQLQGGQNTFFNTTSNECQWQDFVDVDTEGNKLNNLVRPGADTTIHWKGNDNKDFQQYLHCNGSHENTNFKQDANRFKTIQRNVMENNPMENDEVVQQHMPSLSQSFPLQSSSFQLPNPPNICVPQVIQKIKKHPVLSTSAHLSTKPPLALIALAEKAIKSQDANRMTLKEIYQWIMKEYPFYRCNVKKWQNSLRHCLSFNDCFVKVPRSGASSSKKNCYWTLHPDAKSMFTHGSYLRRSEKFRCKKTKKHDKDNTPLLC